MIPQLFDWTGESVEVKWTQYKKCLDLEAFFEDHPSLTSLAISYARLGFSNSELGLRLAEHIRVKFGEQSSMFWSEFVFEVDRFLGDTFKRDYVQY